MIITTGPKKTIPRGPDVCQVSGGSFSLRGSFPTVRTCERGAVREADSTVREADSAVREADSAVREAPAGWGELIELLSIKRGLPESPLVPSGKPTVPSGNSLLVGVN